ncbi:MAG: hypothetical protein VX498_14055 [Myxococcota bacterium]|nr:hypothetical protein [Myxococcota bacterium]
MDKHRRRVCTGLVSVSVVLLLTGCPPVRGDDDDTCEDSMGTLTVCATYAGDPSEGSVSVRTGPQDELPLSGLLDAEGCVRFDLPAGHYEWQATHAWDSCISQWAGVTVEPCNDTAATVVELVEHCFDGLDGR